MVSTKGWAATFMDDKLSVLLFEMSSDKRSGRTVGARKLFGLQLGELVSEFLESYCAGMSNYVAIQGPA